MHAYVLVWCVCVDLHICDDFCILVAQLYLIKFVSRFMSNLCMPVCGSSRLRFLSKEIWSAASVLGAVNPAPRCNCISAGRLKIRCWKDGAVQFAGCSANTQMPAWIWTLHGCAAMAGSAQIDRQCTEAGSFTKSWLRQTHHQVEAIWAIREMAHVDRCEFENHEHALQVCSSNWSTDMFVLLRPFLYDCA